MSEPDRPDLSIVIPALDEAERLPQTLERLVRFLCGQRWTWEIVLSDDGSTDGTAASIARLAEGLPLRIVRSPHNRGKGHAVRVGMLAARGAIRVMCDADGSMPAEELPKLIAPLLDGSAQVAIGSRYLGASRANGQPAWRRAWSRLSHAVVQRTLVPGIRDTQCGYKAFTARAAEEIFGRATIDGWAFDLEVLALAPRLGHRVLEVAVEWRDDGRSRVRAWRDLARVAGEALRIRRNLERGLYRLPIASPTARAYVGWLARRRARIFTASALLVAAALYLIAFHLPLRADFSDLLPADAPSVLAARRLEARLAAKDTLLMLVVAPEPAVRAAAAEEALAAVRAIDRDLVERVLADDDDVAARAFVRAHRHLYVPLADLETARDALARRLGAAKARANPLFVSLDGGEDAAATDPPDRGLAALRARWDAAEARLARSAFVSADGHTQVLIVRTSFRATDVDRDRRLQRTLDAIAARVRAGHPSVSIGFAGGVTAAVAEHEALVRGMLLSSLISGVLVVLVLLLHLRDVRVLGLVTANILAATVASFGIAALTVGHLNAATAFLGAIIAGNGVNYGILLAARYLEERPAARSADAALATAIAGTLRPTLVASLGAAVAYGALAASGFQGLNDFAAIGAIGMLVCWLASFVLLPALILRFSSAPRGQVSPFFGKLVLGLFGFRRPALVCAIAAIASAGAALVCWRYAAGDPFEYDMAQLRSRGPDAARSRHWLRVADEAFGRGLAGVAGQTFIAVERPDQVPAIVEALEARKQREPIIGQVSSILDAVPADQARKLAVLAQLRAQLDDAARSRDGALRAGLDGLRPPDGLRAISARDLPPGLASGLTERDGRVGCLVSVRPGPTFDEWNGRDLIRFAGALRDLVLEGGGAVSAAGPSMLFADLLTTIHRDGPVVTALAALGLLVLVTATAGSWRRALAVLIATAAGSLFMVAACALAGLKINFLDFVALPITLGLGVDYAINLAHRATADDPRTGLRSTGGTVLVCSLTTVIGYGSLLASDNLAIRGFGTASLIGELTCATAALLLVPAILALPGLRHREQTARTCRRSPL